MTVVSRRRRLVAAVAQAVMAGGPYGLLQYYVPPMSRHDGVGDAVSAGTWFGALQAAIWYWTAPLTQWFRRQNQ